jgi:fluoride ion exporter CrcB/FEX
VSRHGVERAFDALAHGGAGFPWGTFGVNLSGAFFLGWILARAETGAENGDWLRCFAGIGFCGAFTTFSSVNLEMLEMIGSQAALLAGVYCRRSLKMHHSRSLQNAPLFDGMKSPFGSAGKRAQSGDVKRPKSEQTNHHFRTPRQRLVAEAYCP